MQDKEKLSKLIDIVGDLIKVEGNEWMIDHLLQTIGEISSMEEISKHSIIQNIHEYCIEQKIEDQASDFYGDFKIESIRDQLIEDYKRMEHDRRRDDFENFGLRVYQQLECITNYLFENHLQKKWEVDRNKFAVKSKWDEVDEEYVYPAENVITLEKLVFETAKDRTWYANRKFRAVLYYFYFNKEIKGSTWDFNSIYNVQLEIYQMRNKNHRGGSKTEFQQQILDKIEGMESKYYFKFYGFLQDFIVNINNNITEAEISNNKKKTNALLRAITRKNKNRTKGKNHKTTLGDIPGLKDISNKLKNDDN